jgi:hypothetical protein
MGVQIISKEIVNINKRSPGKSGASFINVIIV